MELLERFRSQRGRLFHAPQAPEDLKEQDPQEATQHISQVMTRLTELARDDSNNAGTEENFKVAMADLMIHSDGTLLNYIEQISIFAEGKPNLREICRRAVLMIENVAASRGVPKPEPELQ